MAKQKVNPWAVCHAQLGKEKTDKFERCVKKVKSKHGIEEQANWIRELMKPGRKSRGSKKRRSTARQRGEPTGAAAEVRPEIRIRPGEFKSGQASIDATNRALRKTESKTETAAPPRRQGGGREKQRARKTLMRPAGDRPQRHLRVAEERDYIKKFLKELNTAPEEGPSLPEGKTTGGDRMKTAARMGSAVKREKAPVKRKKMRDKAERIAQKMVKRGRRYLEPRRVDIEDVNTGFTYGMSHPETFKGRGPQGGKK